MAKKDKNNATPQLEVVGDVKTTNDVTPKVSTADQEVEFVGETNGDEEYIYTNDLGEEVSEDLNLDEQPKTRLQKKDERKEDRKAELNRIGNNLAAWWNAFNNYEEDKPATTSGGTTTNSETTTGASATTPQGSSTTGVTTTTGAPTTTPQGTPTNVGVANQVDGASTTTATTTNGGASTTTDDSNLTPLQKAEKNYREAGEALKQGINKSHEALIQELKGSQSVYQKMVEKALENKSNLAERKERNARSRALTNALGTLIGTFTAHGMAKKGGYAPIVNAHDSSVDSDYRKSLEQRYALENEKENLLMQLEQDRRKHEADIAGKLYDKDVKNLEIDYKNAADIYKTAIKRENKLEQWDHEKDVAEIKSGKKREQIDEKNAVKQRKGKATNFIKGVFNGVKSTTKKKVGGVPTAETESEYKITDDDVLAGTTIMDKANKKGANLDAVQAAMNYVALNFGSSKIYNGKLQDVIIAMVVNGNSQAEIEEELSKELTK